VPVAANLAGIVASLKHSSSSVVSDICKSNHCLGYRSSYLAAARILKNTLPVVFNLFVIKGAYNGPPRIDISVSLTTEVRLLDPHP